MLEPYVRCNRHSIQPNNQVPIMITDSTKYQSSRGNSIRYYSGNKYNKQRSRQTLQRLENKQHWKCV